MVSSLFAYYFVYISHSKLQTIFQEKEVLQVITKARFGTPLLATFNNGLIMGFAKGILVPDVPELDGTKLFR